MKDRPVFTLRNTILFGWLIALACCQPNVVFMDKDPLFIVNQRLVASMDSVNHVAEAMVIESKRLVTTMPNVDAEPKLDSLFENIEKCVIEVQNMDFIYLQNNRALNRRYGTRLKENSDPD